MTSARRRVLHGRRHGRRLRAGRQHLVDTLLPHVTLDMDTAAANPAAGFGTPVDGVWLEVGFGAGEHLAATAADHPEIGFIGCEVFVNGVASLLSRIAPARGSSERDNIRIFAEDARLLLERLPAASIGRVFVLFPDPWPKKRHNRRRFLSPPQLDQLAWVMAPGAEMRVATDHSDYLRWILFHCLRHPAFEWMAAGPADWRERPAGWPETRYERKARAAGRRCVFLRFRRRPEGPDGQKDLVADPENA
jgi:tRNA (guanine-N7-)-methyltransferase